MNILLIFPGFVIALIIVFCYEHKSRRTEPKNKVHFFVARDEDGNLYLYMGKPIRGDSFFASRLEKGGKYIGCGRDLKMYGLNKNDYANLKWEDEPVEVFVNMED